MICLEGQPRGGRVAAEPRRIINIKAICDIDGPRPGSTTLHVSGGSPLE